VPDDEIVRRLSTRRVCRSCGLTQSVSADEATGEACPYCGGTLERREDDDAETVKKRLATYAAFAGPLVAHYRTRPRLVTIDGVREPDKVSDDIFRGLNALT
jgi:adenylate kinase